MRLHFDEPIIEDLSVDVVEETIVRTVPATVWTRRAGTAPRVISHRRPTRTPADGPVRDCEGVAVWRVKVSGADEVTCTDCGETFPARWRYCPRCNEMEDGVRVTNTVPTLSYLRPNEYELS